MKKSAVSLTVILIISVFLLLSGCSSDTQKSTKITPDDLSQGRIGVLSGSAATVYASDIEGSAVLVFNTQEEMVSALTNGDIDYIMTDYRLAKSITLSNMDLAYTASPVFGTSDFVVALRTQDTDLYGLVLVALTELKNKGTLDEIADRFVGLPADMQENGVTDDVTGENGTVVLGTSADFPPFEYVDNSGRVCGMDIEIAKYIARKGGYTLEIINLDRDGLLPSLAAGTVDIVISAFSKPDSHDASIGFTDPYYTCNQYIVYLPSR